MVFSTDIILLRTIIGNCAEFFSLIATAAEYKSKRQTSSVEGIGVVSVYDGCICDTWLGFSRQVCLIREEFSRSGFQLG